VEQGVPQALCAWGEVADGLTGDVVTVIAAAPDGRAPTSLGRVR
jgi:hypothetical protein